MLALPFVYSEPPLPPLMKVVTPPVIVSISSLTLAVEKITSDIDTPVFLHEPSVRFISPTQTKPSFHFWGNRFVHKFSKIRVHGLPPFSDGSMDETVFIHSEPTGTVTTGTAEFRTIFSATLPKGN